MTKKPRTEKPDKDSSPPAVFKTRKAAAEYAKVSIRTISNWVLNDTNNVLCNDKGYYIRASIDKFAKNDGVADGPKFQKLTAEAGYKDVKRKLAQIELDQKEGYLIPIDQVRQGRIDRIMAVKRALLVMGRKLAKQLAAENNPRKVAAVINKEARAIINGFAGEKVV
jgi:hypothetical protein